MLSSAADKEWIPLVREVTAIAVPDGFDIPVPAGTEVQIIHQLGGDFTVRNRFGALFRIDGAQAGALGKDVPEPTYAADPNAPYSEESVEDALRTCYDPEIPVNVLDLGLIYEMVTEKLEEGGHRVLIKMTLTAPGCGMGQVIVDDVHFKVASVPGVAEVKVDLVFDPPWTPALMTESARLQTGLA